MRDNQEMASILFNSNLATADHLNSNWGEITEDRDIGQILVDKGLLLPKVYQDLLEYIDSLHPENIVIEPDTETNFGDDKSFDELLDSGFTAVKPEATSEPAPSVEIEPEDSIIVPSEDYSPEEDEDVEEEQTESAPLSGAEVQDEHPHIPGEAFVVDLGDVEPHTEEEEMAARASESAIIYGETSDMISDFKPTQEPHQGGAVLDAVQQKMNGGVSVQQPSALSQPIQQQPPAPAQVTTHEEAEGSYGGNRLPEMSAESRIPEQLAITIPEVVSPTNSLDEILLFARNNSVSDIHLIPDAPITMRRFGKLHNMGEEFLTSDIIEEMLLASLPAKEMEIFHKTGDSEFVYTISGGGRYRVTIMKTRNGWSFTARVIPFSIASFDEIGLSESAYSLTRWAQGLVLVTGPAGCGKSATLATLVETINRERNEHIITIEDPVETIFPLGQSQITQRQIGQHTLSQDNALRGALRQDPDILMVSELRDMDSIQLAVSAAETGHLVFGTMNTTNAIRTINRLVESFPADEQDVIRSMVSESLRGVIAQQLIPKKDGSGVVPAFEVLLVTPAVANMIRKNEMHQLESAMVTGRNQGMVLFDDSLMELAKDDLITGEEAYSRANDKENFKVFLGKSEVN